jgi:hypothetical protein
MFSPNLMQQIVNYLVTKPYNEVAALVAAIAQEDQANKQTAPTAVAVPVTDEVKPE